MQQFISCRLCSEDKVRSMRKHLRTSHRPITTLEYQERFPDAPIHSEKFASCLRKREATCLMKYGVKEISLSKELMDKRRINYKQKYGVGAPMQNPEVQKKWKDRFVAKYGVETALQVPLFNKKAQINTQKTMLKRFGTKYYFQNEEKQQDANSKARYAYQPKSSERVIIEMNIPNLKFVGNQDFWITFSNRRKNPDFVVRPFSSTKKVIEVVGEYWHNPEDIADTLNEYKKLGIECLVLTHKEIIKKSTRDQLKQQIVAFVSSETARLDHKSDMIQSELYGNVKS